MELDSHVTIRVVGSADQLQDEAALWLSIENSLGAYDLELIDNDNRELIWAFVGPETTSENIRDSLAPVANHHGVTLRMVYTADLAQAGSQSVFYVGPGADLEYAADLVGAISKHIDSLAQLVRSNKVKTLTILDMFDGTGLRRDMLDTLLYDYIKEAESSVE